MSRLVYMYICLLLVSESVWVCVSSLVESTGNEFTRKAGVLHETFLTYLPHSEDFSNTFGSAFEAGQTWLWSTFRINA